MQPELSRSRSALVFGGTGAVGAEVLRGLARAAIPTTFVYHRSVDKARALAAEHGQRAVCLDLASAAEVRALCRDLDVSHFIHCAVTSKPTCLDGIDDAEWEHVIAVNARSAFIACRELVPRMAARKDGHIVLVGALDRAQSLPLPIHFAASQGMLSAMCMAIAREVGGDGVRANMVASGLLEQGMSRDLAPQATEDYKQFSALRRPGRPAEVARAILWLALENTYMNGKVVPVNGGI